MAAYHQVYDSRRKSSTSFGWGNGGNVTSAGWQVILCDPIWHVSSRSGEVSRELLYSVYLLNYLLTLRHLQADCQELGSAPEPYAV